MSTVLTVGPILEACGCKDLLLKQSLTIVFLYFYIISPNVSINRIWTVFSEQYWEMSEQVWPFIYLLYINPTSFVKIVTTEQYENDPKNIYLFVSFLLYF